MYSIGKNEPDDSIGELHRYSQRESMSWIRSFGDNLLIKEAQNSFVIPAEGIKVQIDSSGYMRPLNNEFQPIQVNLFGGSVELFSKSEPMVGGGDTISTPDFIEAILFPDGSIKDANSPDLALGNVNVSNIVAISADTSSEPVETVVAPAAEPVPEAAAGAESVEDLSSLNSKPMILLKRADGSYLLTEPGGGDIQQFKVLNTENIDENKIGKINSFSSSTYDPDDPSAFGTGDSSFWNVLVFVKDDSLILTSEDVKIVLGRGIRTKPFSQEEAAAEEKAARTKFFKKLDEEERASSGSDRDDAPSGEVKKPDVDLERGDGGGMTTEDGSVEDADADALPASPEATVDNVVDVEEITAPEKEVIDQAYTINNEVMQEAQGLLEHLRSLATTRRAGGVNQVMQYLSQYTKNFTDSLTEFNNRIIVPAQNAAASEAAKASADASSATTETVSPPSSTEIALAMGSDGDFEVYAADDEDGFLSVEAGVWDWTKNKVIDWKEKSQGDFDNFVATAKSIQAKVVNIYNTVGSKIPFHKLKDVDPKQASQWYSSITNTYNNALNAAQTTVIALMKNDPRAMDYLVDPYDAESSAPSNLGPYSDSGSIDGDVGGGYESGGEIDLASTVNQLETYLIRVSTEEDFASSNVKKAIDVIRDAVGG